MDGWDSTQKHQGQDAAAGGDPSYPPGGLEGGDHQAVVPQDGRQRGLRNVVESTPDRLQEAIQRGGNTTHV